MNIENFDSKQLLVFGIIIIIIAWYLIIGRFWVKALLAGVRITPIQIVLMLLRGNPVNLIVKELIKAAKGGVVIGRDELEACYMAGGNISNVVDGLIYAKVKNIELDVKTAMQIDLQKQNIISNLRNKL